MRKSHRTPKKKRRLWPLIILVFGVLIFIIAASDNNGPTKTPTTPTPPGHGLTYTILDEGLYDSPIKVMVDLYIVPEGPLSADTLTALLRGLYAEIAARTGYRYGRHPTQIFIYAYADKEARATSGSFWLAMLYWSEGDAEPDIDVDERRIQAAAARPSTP